MEGDYSQMPFEWLVSRVCEEFHCLPSQAVKELMDDPLQMATEIMSLRSYADAKDALYNAKSPEEVPDSKAVDQVMRIQAELMKQEKQEQERQKKERQDGGNNS